MLPTCWQLMAVKALLVTFSNLSCTYFNVRSIVNKLQELHQLLYSNTFDIIFITESWLHDEVTDGLLNPHSCYAILRKDRKLCRGGGVCIFIKKSFNHIPVIFDSKYDELEIIGFDLFTGIYSVRYFAVYRRPTFDSAAVSYMTELLDCLSVYGSVNRTVVIVGDFNLSKIDWDSYTSPSDTIHQMLVSFVVHFGLTQLINFKTHESNILDLLGLICNDVNYISRLQADVPFGSIVIMQQ